MGHNFNQDSGCPFLLHLPNYQRRVWRGAKDKCLFSLVRQGTKITVRYLTHGRLLGALDIHR